MIEVRDLVKRYGEVRAVDGLSFSVPPGKVTGLLGPNGAGKSTTMRLILGLDKPDSGVAMVDGRHFSHLRGPLHQVGAVLDARDVHPELRGYEHLLALARGNGIGRRRVDEMVELVGLDSASRRRVRGFSLGMLQRLGIAGALLGDPATLVFDEPVNGLDPDGVRWIRSLVRTLAREGRTVLISSHLLGEMEKTADRLVVIGRGRLIAEAEVEEFIADSGLDLVRLRSPKADRLRESLERRGGRVEQKGPTELSVTGMSSDAVGLLAHDENVPLLELSREAASLEEAFVLMTAESLDHPSGGDSSVDSGVDYKRARG